MDYGRLLGDSWRLTWRNPFLWVFGLFAGGSCTGSFGDYDFGGDDRVDEIFADPGLQRAGETFIGWLSANLWLVLALAGLAMLVGLVLIVLHFIAEGALIGATARLAAGETVRSGEAWAIGRRFAWRYVRLALVLFLIAVVLGAIALVAVLIAVGVGQASTGAGIGLGLLFAAVAILVGLPLAIGFAIVVSYANRAIVIDDLGARASLVRGIALLRQRLGVGLILWLLSLAVAIAVAIALVIAALILLVPLGLLGLVAYLTWSLSAPTIVIGAGLGVVFLVAMWLFLAIGNVFGSAYWTLAYLSLTDRYPVRAESAVAAP